MIPHLSAGKQDSKHLSSKAIMGPAEKCKKALMTSKDLLRSFKCFKIFPGSLSAPRIFNHVKGFPRPRFEISYFLLMDLPLCCGGVPDRFLTIFTLESSRMHVFQFLAGLALSANNSLLEDFNLLIDTSFFYMETNRQLSPK